MGIEDSFMWDDGVGYEEHETTEFDYFIDKYDNDMILQHIPIEEIERYLRKKKLENIGNK